MKVEVLFLEVDGFFYGLDYCFFIVGVVNLIYFIMMFYFKGVDYEFFLENVFVVLDMGGSICLVMVVSMGFSIMGNI